MPSLEQSTQKFLDLLKRAKRDVEFNRIELKCGPKIRIFKGDKCYCPFTFILKWKFDSYYNLTALNSRDYFNHLGLSCELMNPLYSAIDSDDGSELRKSILDILGYQPPTT